jgi:hypothetical protein
MNRRYLPVYLNDHYAASVAAHELVKRAAGSNEGTEYGTFLAELERGIAEDRAALERLMDRFEVKKDHLKMTGAFIGEKLGRLKPNAHLTGYSPLSRVVELEVLSLGVEGKLGLWRALRPLADVEPDLDTAELDVLIERATRQRQGLETHRVNAVEEALTAPED